MQGPTTPWGRVFPITGAPLIGAPLANPAAVMNAALERAEHWAEVACFHADHPAAAGASAAAQPSPRPNWYRW